MKVYSSYRYPVIHVYHLLNIYISVYTYILEFPQWVEILNIGDMYRLGVFKPNLRALPQSPIKKIEVTLALS